MNLIKTYIKHMFEFADQRKEALADLRSLAQPYTQHICKLILWGSQSENWKKDWIDEIYNYLYTIASIDLKGNKRLKEKDYLEYFFFKYLEAEWELKNKLERTEKWYRRKENYPEPNKIDTEKVYENYKNFVNNIVKDVVKDEVDYQTTIELCNKYLVGEK